VKNAIDYFAANLDDEAKETIEMCLDTALLSFIDEYSYEYDGRQDIEEKGLTIVGYESAWLADLVAAYILENMTQHFETHKVQRNLQRRWNRDLQRESQKGEVIDWLGDFQNSINELAGNDFLKFTASVWGA
jgi:hypothetical protein